MEKLLTAKEAAQLLGVSVKTVRAWLNDRKIPGTRLPSGDMRFDPAVIERWLQNRTIKAKAFTS